MISFSLKRNKAKKCTETGTSRVCLFMEKTRHIQDMHVDLRFWPTCRYHLSAVHYRWAPVWNCPTGRMWTNWATTLQMCRSYWFKSKTTLEASVAVYIAFEGSVVSLWGRSHLYPSYIWRDCWEGEWGHKLSSFETAWGFLIEICSISTT